MQHIAGTLSASQDEATWVLTSYLVANAMVLPISGWIANRIGRKRFYMTCVFLFTVCSLLCGLAPTLGCWSSSACCRGRQAEAFSPANRPSWPTPSAPKSAAWLSPFTAWRW